MNKLSKKIPFLIWFFLSLSLFCVILWTSKCSLRKKIFPKNVLLITLDTQRSDYISAYREGNAHTPNIDYLAENGILFEYCYSPIPITVPAHASLFYSLAPHELKLYNNGQIFRNDKRRTSLARTFQKRGYRTAAFVSLGVLKSKFNLDDGFDEYVDSLPQQRWYLPAEEINNRVFPWIDKNSENSFFLWIHYSDPHDPYAPPTSPPDVTLLLNGQPYKDFCFQRDENLSLPLRLMRGENKLEFIVVNPYPDFRDEFRVSLDNINFRGAHDSKINFEGMNTVIRNEQTSLLIKKRGRITIDNPNEELSFTLEATGKIYLLPEEKVGGYLQEVEYMDRQIGRLIDELKLRDLLEKTLIVLVGDHGEGLGDHRTRLGEPHFGHIHFLYAEYLRVPFIIFNPLLKEKGLRKKDQVTLLDVAPTVLGMMGWPKLSSHQGIDILRKKRRENHIFICETFRPESTRDRFSAISYPWHLLFSPSEKRFELYDLSLDPEEGNDLYEREKSSPRIVVMQNTLKSSAAKILLEKKDIPLDPDSLEMLRSLGYIKE